MEMNKEQCRKIIEMINENQFSALYGLLIREKLNRDNVIQFHNENNRHALEVGSFARKTILHTLLYSLASTEVLAPQEKEARKKLFILLTSLSPHLLFVTDDKKNPLEHAVERQEWDIVDVMVRHINPADATDTSSRHRLEGILKNIIKTMPNENVLKGSLISGLILISPHLAQIGLDLLLKNNIPLSINIDKISVPSFDDFSTVFIQKVEHGGMLFLGNFDNVFGEFTIGILLRLMEGMPKGAENLEKFVHTYIDYLKECSSQGKYLDKIEIIVERFLTANNPADFEYIQTSVEALMFGALNLEDILTENFITALKGKNDPESKDLLSRIQKWADWNNKSDILRRLSKGEVQKEPAVRTEVEVSLAIKLKEAIPALEQYKNNRQAGADRSWARLFGGFTKKEKTEAVNKLINYLRGEREALFFEEREIAALQQEGSDVFKLLQTHCKETSETLRSFIQNLPKKLSGKAPVLGSSSEDDNL